MSSVEKLKEIVPASKYKAFCRNIEREVRSIDSTDYVKRSTILNAGRAAGIGDWALERSLFCEENRVSRGYYNIRGEVAFFPITDEETRANFAVASAPVSFPAPSPAPSDVTAPSQQIVESVENNIKSCEAKIPQKDPLFVPWGNYVDLKKIASSGQFFPTYISGPSGNGKSIQIKQICAELKKKYVRVQFTEETSEDSLIGYHTLIHGNLIWVDGPVIVAMKEGAVLLLDEFDRSSAAGSLALQGVLEGTPVLVKKTGEVIYPEEGFQVFATGNTKSRGDDSGRYTFANILDDSTLERFVADIEQDFPKKAQLTKIFGQYYAKKQEDFNKPEEEVQRFITDLISWGEVINESFQKEAIEETLSVRRLVHTLKAYSVFGNAKKAVQLTINRFDLVHREAFLDLFKKVSLLMAEQEAQEDQGVQEGQIRF